MVAGSLGDRMSEILKPTKFRPNVVRLREGLAGLWAVVAAVAAVWFWIDAHWNTSNLTVGNWVCFVTLCGLFVSGIGVMKGRRWANQVLVSLLLIIFVVSSTLTLFYLWKGESVWLSS